MSLKFGVVAIKVLISFIMPIGNLEREFDNIVANVSEFEKIDQSELILVIDSGEHPKASILSEMYSENQCVIVLQGCYGNPGDSRNFGKEHSNGEWISFIDSDDVIDFRNYYQLVVEGNLAGAEIIFGRYREINEDGIVTDPKESISYQNIAKSIARNPGIWRLSFKRNLVDKSNFPGLRMAEDQIFLARVRFWEHNIWISHLLVYTYRRNISGQLTRSIEAISDLLRAQEITLGLYLNEQDKSSGSQILAIMVVNQLITSLKYLGLQGLVPLRKIYKTEIGLVRVLRITARLSWIILGEILHKTRKMKKVSKSI